MKLSESIHFIWDDTVFVKQLHHSKQFDRTLQLLLLGYARRESSD
jgi:hypothetical protein